MNTKKIKLLTTFLLLLPLCVVILGGGCEDEKRDPLCYQGKVVSLNNGRCYNIIEIVETINNTELLVGTTITFDPELYGKKLNLGDVVFFKIIQYNEWTGPSTADCLWPKYTAQIKFCNY